MENSYVGKKNDLRDYAQKYLFKLALAQTNKRVDDSITNHIERSTHKSLSDSELADILGGIPTEFYTYSTPLTDLEISKLIL